MNTVHKKRIIILAVLLIFMVLVISFFFYNKIDTIHVKGCQYYSEEEIKENLLQGISGKNSILLYLKARYFGLKDIPYIEKVTIKRVNRNEITIQVYEKSLIASIKYMGEYLYFDKDGIILDASSKALKGVPCISGIKFSGFVIYEKLMVDDNTIFNHILSISQIIKRYELAIDRIHFNSKNEISLIAGNIKIYLGNKDFYDEPIAALSEILPKLLKDNLKGTINMENYKEGDNVIFRKI